MDQQILKGKWNEFKGEIRKLWGDVTDDELERTKGDVRAIGGLLQQKYGQFKDDTRTRFNGLIQRFGQGASDRAESIKDKLRDDVRRDH
jgi:uncharacterized protein YjbJ (UPF0337 family)